MLKKTLSPGNSILNSAINLYCSIKGSYPSDHEIAKEFGIGQPTLHRWRKGKVTLDQIALLARILQKIPKELRTMPFDSFQSTLEPHTLDLPGAPAPFLTELTLSPFPPTRLLSGIIIVGQSAATIAANLSLQMLLEPLNRFNENLLLHPEATTYYQTLSELPSLRNRAQLLLPAETLPHGTKTFVGSPAENTTQAIIQRFLERIGRSRSFELDPGHRSLLLAPISGITEAEQSLELIQIKRLSTVLYTDSLAQILPPLRRSLLRKCKKLLYLHSNLEPEQNIFNEITKEYKMDNFQLPLSDLKKEATLEEGYLCQTAPTPQVTRRRFTKTL